MSDTWAELEETTGGQPDGSLEEGGFHESDGMDQRQGDPEEVVDVDASEQPKKKSRVGAFAIAGVSLIVGLGAVGAIGSKVMSILSPPGPQQARMESVRPLQQPLDAPQPAVAMPGGIQQTKVDEPAVSPVSPPDSAVAEVPAAPSPQIAMPVTRPENKAITQECDADKSELDALRRELDEKNAKLAAIDAEKRRLADARAKRKASAPRYAKKREPPARTKVASAPQQTAAVKAVATPVDPAQSKPVATAGDIEAKPLASESVVSVATVDKTARLPGYSLIAMYPNTGDFKAVHLRDSRGRNVVVREGELLGSARVTKIDPTDWLVETTEGVIR